MERMLSGHHQHGARGRGRVVISQRCSLRRMQDNRTRGQQLTETRAGQFAQEVKEGQDGDDPEWM